MAKPRLRVTRWIGTTPAIAVCTLCQREFRVPVALLKKVAEAQQFLTVQFAGHTCEEKKQ